MNILWLQLNADESELDGVTVVMEYTKEPMRSQCHIVQHSYESMDHKLTRW